MIYLRYIEYARDRFPNLPEYVCYKGVLDMIPLKARYYASYIFEFIGEETVYYKDRTGDNYQYTGEEKVVLALKAVLI
jgi:hypothetical protein